MPKSINLRESGTLPATNTDQINDKQVGEQLRSKIMEQL